MSADEGKSSDRNFQPNCRTQNRMVGVWEKMKSSLVELRVGTRRKSTKAVPLKAGALTVDFVAGGLRTIRYEGHEVLRAIAYLVRDQNWATYNPEISECVVEKTKDAFTITYRARCASADPTPPSRAR